MRYQHQILRNHPQETIYKFERSTPYIPIVGDNIVFPEDWRHGEWFKITSVDHYVVDRLIVIRVNQI